VGILYDVAKEYISDADRFVHFIVNNNNDVVIL